MMRLSLQELLSARTALMAPNVRGNAHLTAAQEVEDEQD